MKGKIGRVDEEFMKDMDDAAKMRILKGFANPRIPKEISYHEMTRLLRRTTHYPLALEELKTKPKKIC